MKRIRLVIELTDKEYDSLEDQAFKSDEYPAWYLKRTLLEHVRSLG